MNAIVIAFLVLLLNLTGSIVLDSDLCYLAEERARHIAVHDDFRHNDYILARAGCASYGEIMGRTTGAISDLYEAFVRSPLHLKVMIGEWDSVGIGMASNAEWGIIVVVGFCKEWKVK